MPRLASLDRRPRLLIAALGGPTPSVQLAARRGGARLSGYGPAAGDRRIHAGSPVELSLSPARPVALSVASCAGRALRRSRRAGTAQSSTGGMARLDWSACRPPLTTAPRRRSGAAASGRGRGGRPGGQPHPRPPPQPRDRHPASPPAGHADRGIDASLGGPGHRDPMPSIERHRRWLARNPDHRLSSSAHEDRRRRFDQKFSVHGTAPLLSDRSCSPADLRHGRRRAQPLERERCPLPLTNGWPGRHRSPPALPTASTTRRPWTGASPSSA